MLWILPQMLPAFLKTNKKILKVINLFNSVVVLQHTIHAVGYENFDRGIPLSFFMFSIFVGLCGKSFKVKTVTDPTQATVWDVKALAYQVCDARQLTVITSR